MGRPSTLELMARLAMEIATLGLIRSFGMMVASPIGSFVKAADYFEVPETETAREHTDESDDRWFTQNVCFSPTRA